VTVLWHRLEPVGICVFTAPPLSLAQRNQFFQSKGRWSRLRFQLLNSQRVNLSRIVLHPTYRGAGLGARFLASSCADCPYPWIESLTEMGNFNPFFEKAGFQRIGMCSSIRGDRRGHSALYGSPQRRQKRLVSNESHRKSRHAQPVYYILDNRAAATRHHRD